jgi:undecaprenyl-diphosphatase
LCFIRKNLFTDVFNITTQCIFTTVFACFTTVEHRMATSPLKSRGMMANRLDGIDRGLMERINDWTAPVWIRVWMLAASRLGDGWLWWSIGFAILLAGGRHRYEVLVAGGVAVGVAQGVGRLLKIAVSRERPGVARTHVWARVPPPDPYSFPSAHTMTAFAFTLAVGLGIPELLWWLLFAAGSVAASRVVLGLHYVSDVVVGGVLGAGIGWAAHLWL